MKSIKADASSVSPSSLISSDLGLTLERSALKLFTVANAHYQLSWNPQKSLQIKWQILCSFINCGVIQEFPGPEKSRNNTREKISYFFTCVCWYSQSAADTSLAFGATWPGWWMNGKAFTILNESTLSGLSRIMAAKTQKNFVSLTDIEVQNFLEWEENQYSVRNRKLRTQWLENRQLNELPLADFGRLPERLLLSVRKKSINENFVNWKLRPLLFLYSWFNAFSILRVSDNALYDCYSGIVDTIIFIH